MESRSRRSFLKIAGISAVGLGVKPVLSGLAATAGHGEAPRMVKGDAALRARRWGMVIDTTRFTSARDFDPMIRACHKVHNVPQLANPNHEIKWIWTESFHNAFPDLEHDFITDRIRRLPFLVLCNHCQDPPCVRACPTRATFKDPENGIVKMDMHRCIGCRFCMAACPFGARSFNFRDPRPFIPEVNLRFPTRMKGVVEKCNFCAERLAEGLMPACVEVSDGALVFGDLDNPESDVREMLRTRHSIRRREWLGTKPSVYYVI
jgi:Fe-S-cluster-containing dehydrogenase component